MNRRCAVARPRTLLLALGATLIGSVGGALAAQPPAPATDSTAYAESLSRGFRAAAAKVLPTVVTIKTTTRPRRVSSLGGRTNPFRGTPFEDMFQDGRGPAVIPQRQGLGSGVIIDSQGIVLTNNHVVRESDEILVELSDGREYTATDVKTDPQSDLAVVRFKPDGKLPAARLGDSDQLQIGDWVLAIGSPFGLEATVSAGIISAKGRSLSEAERAQFLQTDAAINPGNSGGPLVNLRGEVVGISTAIASRTGAYQGIGFAIPVNLAKWVSVQLVRDGRVQRSYLGVGVQLLTPDVADQLGARAGQGVVVIQVYPDSPADRAGVRVGDVITRFEQRKIRTPRDLQESVERLDVGRRVQVTYLRDGRERDAAIQLEELPQIESNAPNRSTAGSGRANRRKQPGFEESLGMTVQDLTPEIAQRLGYGQRDAGVLVSGVDPTGIAAQKGIEVGMLILRVGEKDVSSAQQFADKVRGSSLRDGILLMIATPSGKRFVVLRQARR